MTVDPLDLALGGLVRNLYAVVFLLSVVDATGLPVPGRVLLVAAGALSAGSGDTGALILLAAVGALVGDHLLYLIGRLAGARILGWYCRWTMGSGRCIHAAEGHLARRGAGAILLGRFVAGVRLFTAALAGSGIIPYPRFRVFDALGALLWAASLVLLGVWLGNDGPTWSGATAERGS